MRARHVPRQMGADIKGFKRSREGLLDGSVAAIAAEARA